MNLQLLSIIQSFNLATRPVPFSIVIITFVIMRERHEDTVWAVASQAFRGPKLSEGRSEAFSLKKLFCFNFVSATLFLYKNYYSNFFWWKIFKCFLNQFGIMTIFHWIEQSIQSRFFHAYKTWQTELCGL